ncbi:MAG: iron ABC transporter permease [Desulfuromonadales bacterium]
MFDSLRSPGFRKISWIPLLLAFLGAAFFASLMAGPLDLSPARVLALLLGQEENSTAAAVVQRIRLPRALLAAMVGGSLGASGAAFQAVLRNPLADPYILGVSGGAALGAVSALALGVGSVFMPGAAFLGALGALGTVYFVASAHRTSPHTLILAGVMVGSLATALLLFILWSAPAETVRSALFWLTGDLSAADLSWIGPAAVWGAAGLAALWFQSPALDLLTQGEETAADLGLSVGRTRLFIFAAGGALTASAVALAGLIGFVGLVVPHVVRLFWGPEHRRLIPASALLGAAFLVSADALSRTLLSPSEIPVGVITALLGAPFFLYLLRQKEVEG